MEMGEKPILGVKMILEGDVSIDLYVLNLELRGNISSITEIFLKKVNFSATC